MDEACGSLVPDPIVIADAAYVLGELGEDIGAMMALTDRSLALNPSYTRGWFLSGAIRVHAGEHDVAIEHVETSLRLSPRRGFFIPFSVIGSAHFFVGRLEKAVPRIRHGNDKSHALRAESGQVSCGCDSTFPLRGSIGSEFSQCGSGGEVALKIEGNVDGGAHAQEASGGSS